jgi:adenine-specific DNA-methyltransferase
VSVAGVFPDVRPQKWVVIAFARTLAAALDPEAIEAYRGTVSLPFSVGEHRTAAIKVIDKRGIESLRILRL